MNRDKVLEELFQALQVDPENVEELELKLCGAIVDHFETVIRLDQLNQCKQFGIPFVEKYKNN